MATEAPHSATTADGAAPAAHGPFYTDPTFWVGVGFLLFVALLWYLKVHKSAAAALDARSAKIAHDLDEAARLRREAEALLAAAQARYGAAETDAAAIVAQASRGSEELAAQAERDLAAAVARRTKSAADRIDAAGRAAEAELRAQAVDLATATARRVIAADGAPAGLTDAAIMDLDRR